MALIVKLGELTKRLLVLEPMLAPEPVVTNTTYGAIIGAGRLAAVIDPFEIRPSEFEALTVPTMENPPPEVRSMLAAFIEAPPGTTIFLLKPEVLSTNE